MYFPISHWIVCILHTQHSGGFRGARGCSPPPSNLKEYKRLNVLIYKTLKHINSYIKCHFLHFTKYDDPYLQELHIPHHLLHLLSITLAPLKKFIK